MNKDRKLTFKFLDCFITSTTSVDEMVETLRRYDRINRRVNLILKICNYKSMNQVVPIPINLDPESTIYNYSLFSKGITVHTGKSTLIGIISKAIEFENRVAAVIDEKKIIDKYDIKYEDKTRLYFGGTGSVFNTNDSFETIKSELTNMDRWKKFKKKNKTKGE